MLRNREFAFQLVLFCLITTCCSAAAFCLSLTAGWVTLGGTTALGFSFLLFTLQRYHQIARLSVYLDAVRNGARCLDIRDNREGELSILKNDLYKLTVRLQEQSELLQKDKKYLADAIADISHQLKTPLTSMIVMTDLLAEEHLNEEKRREFTQKIKGQLERIEWLVSSLLKLSKIDVGAVEFRRERFLVADAVKKATAPLLIPMELREQALVVSVPEEAVLTGDLGWTVEALINIMKNCVEHTPVGGEIRIVCTENPLHMEIRVQDNGCGIAAADLAHIFERFYRGKNASPDSAGIGLAMAKAILLRQNADIFVESELQRGTVFSLKFYKTVL